MGSSLRSGTHSAPASGRTRRSTVVALSFVACLIAYSDRVNISVAAVAMREEFGWTQTQKGVVLSSFFIGYMLFMLASGWLANRYGGKRVLGLAVLAWSVFTLLTPPAAAISVAALVVVRIAMGIGEAAMFPASYELFGRWVPLTERTRAVGKLMSGIPAGTVIGLMATGWIVKHYDWTMAFYSFGVVGLAWVAIWFRQVGNDPATDARTSPGERVLLLREATPAAAPEVAEPPPWRQLLLRVPVWAMVVSHFATTWTLYVLLSWLPSYFRDVQGLTIANAGLFSAAPWLAMFTVTNIAASRRRARSCSARRWSGRPGSCWPRAMCTRPWWRSRCSAVPPGRSVAHGRGMRRTAWTWHRGMHRCCSGSAIRLRRSRASSVLRSPGGSWT
jgi:ACS family sodium-dependent inorganic phosphate cotransporter